MFNVPVMDQHQIITATTKTLYLIYLRVSHADNDIQMHTSQT